MNILEETNYKCSTSSVLNRDTKQHGKQFMFDCCDDTSWSSDHGTPQWISILLEKPVTVTTITFQFQGGFVGKDCYIQMQDNSECIIYNKPCYPEDINSEQNFTFDNSIQQVKKIKIYFGGSTDFFGRIIVYKLKIFGTL